MKISRIFVDLHVPGDPSQCVDPETGLAHPLNTPWAPAPCQHSTCITFSTTDTQILEERCLQISVSRYQYQLRLSRVSRVMMREC